MLRTDAFTNANVLELAQFFFNCGYEDVLTTDPRNPKPSAYAVLCRANDDIIVADSLSELRALAQAIYDGSHKKTEPNEQEATLKRRIRTLMSMRISYWTEREAAELQEALVDLNEMGWQATYPGEGQVQFSRIQTISRSAAVRSGYVQE